MPANLSPEYKTAEAACRNARARRVSLTGRWDDGATPRRTDLTGDEDPFALRLPNLMQQPLPCLGRTTNGAPSPPPR